MHAKTCLSFCRRFAVSQSGGRVPRHIDARRAAERRVGTGVSAARPEVFPDSRKAWRQP
ncbi:MAG: hypothetical protein HC773_10065 [Scytonema sp. CRU_2_7]|nr:hypothetical protein [Scytonema sp. CRU_2_7]